MYEKAGHSPIKTLSDNWFEMLLITIVLGVVVLAHYLFNVGGAILNFFYLPIIVAAHFYGRTPACALATFSVVAVAIFALFDPGFGGNGTNERLLLIFNLGVWAGFLGLCAILVGTFSDNRRAALRHILNRCMNHEREERMAPSLRVVNTLERVAALLCQAQEKMQRQKVEGAAEILQEALEISQQEVNLALLERQAVDEASDAI